MRDIQKESASLFFRLISKRYEKSSTIITTNKPFEEWADVFGGEVVVSAILDRLLHHSYPFLINGPSYRMKELFKKKQQNTEQVSEIPIPEDENI